MGKIFNIQKFCTDDGPGIRTTVFFKGCHLSCLWCHNPESQSFSNEISYNAERCVSCGRCIERCPNKCHSMIAKRHVYDRSNCQVCTNCVHPTCPAMECYGYEITADDIIKEVMKDEAFYKNSGGGITLSGGEPFAQPQFCLEILKKAKENGLHTCIETCGYVSTEILSISRDYIDLYLFDYKHTDPEKHKDYTGVDNILILENLRYLDRTGKQIFLRCPIVPNFNDTAEHFDGIARIANELMNVKQIELEPYHDLGCVKYERLGKILNKEIKEISILNKDILENILKYIQIKTEKNVILFQK